MACIRYYLTDNCFLPVRLPTFCNHPFLQQRHACLIWEPKGHVKDMSKQILQYLLFLRSRKAKNGWRGEGEHRDTAVMVQYKDRCCWPTLNVYLNRFWDSAGKIDYDPTASFHCIPQGADNEGNFLDWGGGRNGDANWHCDFHLNPFLETA